MDKLDLQLSDFDMLVRKNDDNTYTPLETGAKYDFFAKEALDRGMYTPVTPELCDKLINHVPFILLKPSEEVLDGKHGIIVVPTSDGKEQWCVIEVQTASELMSIIRFVL